MMLAQPLHFALTGTAIVAVMMLILWAVHLAIRNAAIVDVGWAAGLALLGLYYGWAGPGFVTRKIIIASMAAVWGVRLAVHLLFSRVIGQPEEGRYLQLRKEWKNNVSLRFLFFFEFQAILDVVLSIPFLIACLDTRTQVGPLEFTGVALWLVGIIGEAIADRQLESFKKNPENKGKTCRVGLWNYSRHPNYFFEWVIWMGFATFALSSPWGVVGLLAPALILYFLLGLTGIPATEAQALRTRGDEYRAYQRSTSAFVPWFHKKASA